MLIGNIGSLERINYTGTFPRFSSPLLLSNSTLAIGDNVNIASRLESLCKFYQVRILISSVTYESVKDRFLCRPLDKVMVKGRSQVYFPLLAPNFILYCITINQLCSLLFCTSWFANSRKRSLNNLLYATCR